MTTALRSKPGPNPRATGTTFPTTTPRTTTPHLTLDQDDDMTISITHPGAEFADRDPLAPDSRSRSNAPPGEIDVNVGVDIDGALSGDTDDVDESLAARAPVARCADGNGTLTGLFFSDHVVDIARAKAMCALCPLQVGCLADALEREEPWGVWGGELLSGGRIVANKRPCGRPPKHPRPEVVYDEMGPVDRELTVA